MDACNMVNHNSGYYSVRAINDDPDDDTGVELIVGLRMENDMVKMVKFTAPDSPGDGDVIEVYQNGPPTSIPNTENRIVRVDVTLGSNSTVDAAQSIMGKINDAHTKLSGDFGANITQVAVEYMDGIRNHGNHYHDAASTISLNDDAHNRDLTVLHEYGHHVMNSIYVDQNGGGWPRVVGSYSHFIQSAHESKGLVWFEGWASYLALLVRNSPSLTHGVVFDFEDRTYGNPAVPFEDGPFVEGNVAAALWDLTDGTGEPGNGTNQDDVSGMEHIIWDVFDSPPASRGTAPHENFDEFVDQWRQDFPQHNINRVLFLNTYTDRILHPNTLFADELDGDLARWSNTGDGDWQIYENRRSTPPFTSAQTYNVTKADDCDDECILELADPLDLEDYGDVRLGFYYFVDDHADDMEGLKVEASDDGGSTWEELFYWNHDNGGDTDTWERVSGHDISRYASDEFKIRFTALSSAPNEDVQISRVEITGVIDANSAPSMSPIGSQSMDEGGRLSVGISSTDHGGPGLRQEFVPAVKDSQSTS